MPETQYINSPDLDPCMSSNKVKTQRMKERFENLRTLKFSGTIIDPHNNKLEQHTLTETPLATFQTGYILDISNLQKPHFPDKTSYIQLRVSFHKHHLG